ncbi:hypothetical protein F511_17967 [Dorcoceras hygrometricum]|uniref:Uncharacterized protein n=1 Tax=Dorcoceras hygrometricum TaxID=472368 RepID=A0A2Z7ADA5_9LAMI|nr:hypothetical protein F511_17967 [Dorcoceras hygrometricum]
MAWMIVVAGMWNGRACWLCTVEDSDVRASDTTGYFALLLKLQILRLDIWRLDCNSPLHLLSCDCIPCRLDIQSAVDCDCAKAKRCRINLCKRHRFAIDISKYQLLDVRASDNTALSSPCWDRSHHAPSG